MTRIALNLHESFVRIYQDDPKVKHLLIPIDLLFFFASVDFTFFFFCLRLFLSDWAEFLGHLKWHLLEENSGFRRREAEMIAFRWWFMEVET